MKEITRFFWERWRRAVQMDLSNKLQGKPTHTWITTDEWISAYKSTLSKGKQSEFDKEWNKLEAELVAWHNAPPNKQKNMMNPLGVPK